MEQTQFKLFDILKHPENMNHATAEWLRGMVARYPYFQTVRLLFLENLYRIHDVSFDSELRRSALLLADRSVLFDLVESDNYIIPEQRSSEEVTDVVNDADRTLSLIEGYLDTLPAESAKSRFTAKESQQTAKADPTSDYTAYLMKMDREEAAAEAGEMPDVSNNMAEEVFVRKEEKKKSKAVIPLSEKTEYAPEETDNEELPNKDYYTETLAQIFIKQKKYERALEIIKVLRVNNPEKNRYFADQIRFLGQLIAINKTNNKE